ncbi:transposase, partial [Corynebacterium striatum]|uniref:transposase n=1 Tax=Corynebacterium striatum TaxID=43770 RepID=UPI003B5AEA3F
LTGETRLRFWALAGQPPAVVPTNRKQAVPRSRNRGTNYPRSADDENGLYGAKRIAASLNDDKDFPPINHKKVARIMKSMGLKGF